MRAPGNGIWGFWKVDRVCVGPDGELVYPAEGNRLDYEGELAIVSASAASTSSRRARGYMWGVTLLGDWSIRSPREPAGPYRFAMGKNFDTSCSLGPCIAVGETDASRPSRNLGQRRAPASPSTRATWCSRSANTSNTCRAISRSSRRHHQRRHRRRNRRRFRARSSRRDLGARALPEAGRHGRDPLAGGRQPARLSRRPRRRGQLTDGAADRRARAVRRGDALGGHPGAGAAARQAGRARHARGDPRRHRAARGRGSCASGWRRRPAPAPRSMPADGRRTTRDRGAAERHRRPRDRTVRRAALRLGPGGDAGTAGVLAVGEARARAGGEMLAAFILGYDVGGAAGLRLHAAPARAPERPGVAARRGRRGRAAARARRRRDQPRDAHRHDACC